MYKTLNYVLKPVSTKTGWKLVCKFLLSCIILILKEVSSVESLVVSSKELVTVPVLIMVHL